MQKRNQNAEAEWRSRRAILHVVALVVVARLKIPESRRALVGHSGPGLFLSLYFVGPDVWKQMRLLVILVNAFV